MNRKYLIATILGSLAFGGATTLIVQRVRAAGIPATEALTYTGYLEDPDGMPIADTSLAIGLQLFDAEDAVTEVCEVNSAARTLVGGRFPIPLDSCLTAIRDNPDLWAEVSVGGTPLGRAKLGAVPYAVEAGRASGAAGALDGRIAALEARASVKSARVGLDGSETATWISGVTHVTDSGAYGIAFTAGAFATAPACVATAYAGNSKSPAFECFNISTTGAECRANIHDPNVAALGIPVDSGFSILCVAPN